MLGFWAGLPTRMSTIVSFLNTTHTKHLGLLGKQSMEKKEVISKAKFYIKPLALILKANHTLLHSAPGYSEVGPLIGVPMSHIKSCPLFSCQVDDLSKAPYPLGDS